MVPEQQQQQQQQQEEENGQLVLAVNAGSSSLKVSLLFNHEQQDRLLTAHAERLRTTEAVLHIRTESSSSEGLSHSQSDMDPEQALNRLVHYLQESHSDWLERIVAVGHRVVHGGTKFSDSVVVDDKTLEEMKSVSHLAPLHNPSNLRGIHILKKLLPESIQHVAVFDTSFHSSIPEKAYTYPLPKAYRDLHMRKFGFHGTSVRYVAEKATKTLQNHAPTSENKKDDFRMIVCHLGSGASVTAVVGNKSMDTSMGFTPLAGLMMGTRCGSVDPSLVGFACTSLKKTVEEVMTDFNKNSGLMGMVEQDKNDGTPTGGIYDMRTLLESQHDHPSSKLAVDMFVYQLAQHIASMMIALQGSPMDALIFTAGIGEHSSEIRQRTIEELKPVLPQSLQLDEERNRSDGASSNGILTPDGTWPVVLNIPTDEEAMIANECLRLL